MSFVPDKTGNTIWVDSVNGDDASGLSGDDSRPFLTVAAAIAIAVSGDTVTLAPGTYNLSAGITIPAGVTLAGTTPRASRIQMLGVVANTTLVTMSNNSFLYNVILSLSTTGAFSLTGVLFPNTLASVAFMNNVTVIVAKTVAVDAAAVNGVLYQSSIVASAISTNMRACGVSVSSTGTGNNRGALQDTAAGTFNICDSDVLCSGSGSAIGVECNFAGAALTYVSGSISGTTSDISQTLGVIKTSADLINSTANGLGFTAIAPTAILVWGAEAGINTPANRFMVPGSGSITATEHLIRVPRASVIKSLSVRVGTAPAAGTLTVTIRQNGADSVPLYDLVLAAPAVSIQDNAESIFFAGGDDIAIRIAVSAGGFNDAYVTVEVY